MTDLATPTEVTEAAPTLPPLTHADRCDKCSAQAFVRTVLLTGDLLFCGHHFSADEAKLRELAVLVQDERESINAKPSQSSA